MRLRKNWFHKILQICEGVPVGALSQLLNLLLIKKLGSIQRFFAIFCGSSQKRYLEFTGNELKHADQVLVRSGVISNVSKIMQPSSHANNRPIVCLLEGLLKRSCV